MECKGLYSLEIRDRQVHYIARQIHRKKIPSSIQKYLFGNKSSPKKKNEKKIQEIWTSTEQASIQAQTPPKKVKKDEEKVYTQREKGNQKIEEKEEEGNQETQKANYED